MNNDTCVSTPPAESAPVAPGTSAPATAKPGSDRKIDLASIPWGFPQALLNEHEAAAVLGVSVKTLRRQRCEGIGP